MSMSAGFLEEAMDELREQVTILKAERDEARRDLKQFNGIHTSVNEALNRAGIFCAITFAEAIDQIAAERNALSGALALALVGWRRCATCVVESSEDIEAEVTQIDMIQKLIK